MEVKKYRKKPVIIEAVEFDGNLFIEDANEFFNVLHDFFGEDRDKVKVSFMPLRAYITALEGEMEVSDGDYIIKGVKGEFYPCKPDIFKKTYELVVGELY